jgi:hypothetical protein
MHNDMSHVDHLPTYPPTRPPTYLSTYPSTYLRIYLHPTYLFIYLLIHPLTHPPTYLLQPTYFLLTILQLVYSLPHSQVQCYEINM